MAVSVDGIALADLDAALARCEPALETLRDGRLFLTGGTGFFGRWLLAALARASSSRASFARACPGLASDPLFDFVAGDVRDFAAPEGAFSHVIHGATDTSAAGDAQPFELLDTIVAGTRRVLDFALAAGARDVLHLSSGAIYGPQDALERVPELAPRVARGFAFVGAHLPLNGRLAIGNFIADAVAGRAIRIAGDGSPLRSYLFAGDLVAWLLRILTAGIRGRVYNVGSDVAYTLREVAEIVARNVPGARGVEVQGATIVHPRARYVPDVERARSELGLEVWTPLDAAVQRTAAWAQTLR